MNRRDLLRGVSALALTFTEPALARLPHSGGGVSSGGNTIAGAMFATTNVLGGDYIPISLRWTGSAPGSIASATWSGAGGSATIYAGSFTVTGVRRGAPLLPPALAGEAPAVVDDFNERLVVALQEDGSSYLSNTMIGGRFALRGCVLNYRTTLRDMEVLLDDLRRVALSLSSRL